MAINSYQRPWFRPLLLAIALMIIPGRISAQGRLGRLHGQIRDQTTGKPVPAVEVALKGTNLRGVSNDRGLFVITDIPPGTYVLTTDRIGYQSNSGSITYQGAEILEVGIRVTTKPIELDSMRVSIRSGRLAEVGYYDRRDNSGLSGRYVGAEDIEHRNAAGMTDMLVGMPSVKVIHQGPGRVTIRFNRNVPEGSSAGRPGRSAMAGGNGGCEPDLFVDGRLYRQASPPIITSGTGTHFGNAANKVDDFDAIPVNQIAGMEVYVGAAVPAFVPATACGVVLVWLKR
jgi:CarboxypepD_reg-like domain